MIDGKPYSSTEEFGFNLQRSGDVVLLYRGEAITAEESSKLLLMPAIKGYRS
jgi:hypothetical protein